MLSDDDVVTFAAELLKAAVPFVSGPPGIALGVLAAVAAPVYEALKSGGRPDAVVAAIKASLVAASDADMKAELGP